MKSYTTNQNIRINEIGLEGGDNDTFLLFHIITTDLSKSYITDMFVKYKDELVVKGPRSIIPFFSMLRSFTKKILMYGEENDYFKYVEKTENNKTRKSLQCKFDTTRYISVNEALTMTQFFYQSTTGQIPRKHNLGKKILSLSQTFFQVANNKTHWNIDTFADELDSELNKYRVTCDNDMSINEKLSLYIHNIKHSKSTNQLDD